MIQPEAMSPPLPNIDEEVTIVGAGPVGLALGNTLAAAGVNASVIERRTGPLDENQTRSFVVHARTLELLADGGVADELLSAGIQANGIDLYGKMGGAWANVDFRDLPTEHNGILIVPQPFVERALLRRSQELGLPIYYDRTFMGLDQNESGVTVRTVNGTGESWAQQAQFVVGCDGSHSRVRQAIGLDFVEEPFLNSVVLADVKLGDPPPSTTVRGSGAPGHFAFVAPYGPNVLHNGSELHRIIAWSKQEDGKPLREPVSLDTVRAIAHTAFGTDFEMHEAVWTSRFHAREALVPQYRGATSYDRVLLAGDSAHVHSPAGGQGLNLGIGDAVNVGWRLASILKHGAEPEPLLTGYTQERRPVAEEVIKSSHKILKMAITDFAPLQAIRLPLFRTILGIPPARRKITGQLSGIGIAYPREPGDHSLVGKRFRPDTRLDDGSSFAEIQEPGKFVLIAQAGVMPPDIAGYEDRITVAQARNMPAAFVRPDGHIAWTNDGGGAPHREQSSIALQALLARFLGAPR